MSFAGGAAMAQSTIPPRDRLRGIERRPPFSDADKYVQQLVDEKANSVTLGAMLGNGQVFFPTDDAPPHARMTPDYLPTVLSKLNARDISPLCWVVFNIQDVRRSVDQFELSKKYPQWKMKFLTDLSGSGREAVGMCVVSSPYIQQHAKLLKQVAQFDLDGLFFDGFYFNGLPNRQQVGCVCDDCRKAFKQDTGLDLPTKVDWTDMTFKRWVRWRNQRLLKTARYFQKEIHSVNPKISCTFNYNIWPFARKGWETAIPMWRIDDFGVSQHGYTGRFSEKWMMLGFKCRIGRDINPMQTDLWRTGQMSAACGNVKDFDWYRLETLTHILAGLSFGITSWHSDLAGPAEFTAEIHEQVAKRERYFSRKHLADVAVLCSQNTHDFAGYAPDSPMPGGDYRDGLIGTWMALDAEHVPFEFVFDNQLDAKSLSAYRTLILPGTAALSAKSIGMIKGWVKQGGELITTGPTGVMDEWGRMLDTPSLQSEFGIDVSKPASVDVGQGKVTHCPADPGMIYAREHDATAAKSLSKLIPASSRTLSVEAPPSVSAHVFENPNDASQRWVQLLNVSHMAPGGDGGFRGVDRPSVEVRPMVADEEDGKQRRACGAPLVPAKNLVIRLRDGKVKAAHLGVSGQKLTVDADGAVHVPTLDLHEVVVIDLK
ncbi:hypothetical protein HED60_03870 [Planctomycetales bacterium ZRK34]|nr:hypothetical protein HED60_03870 [Planctomycetales bacterium ZRK34]